MNPLGHASFQVIDNESVKNFNEKCDRVVQSIITRLGLVTDETKSRFGKQVKKHKFLVKNYSASLPLPVLMREFSVQRILLNSTTHYFY